MFDFQLYNDNNICIGIQIKEQICFVWFFFFSICLSENEVSHGYLENLDMNETEIIEFSVPMWADMNYIFMRPFSWIKFIVKAIYLELSDKITQTCVLGHLLFFFLTEVY